MIIHTLATFLGLTNRPDYAVTHDGEFHADELLALFIFWTCHPEVPLVRTRDSRIVAGAKWRFDVGGVYEPEIHAYDHHQLLNGPPPRGNGAPVATLGAAWKAFGEQFLRTLYPNLNFSLAEVMKRVDRMFIQGLDAKDSSRLFVEARLTVDRGGDELTDVRLPLYDFNSLVRTHMPIGFLGEACDEGAINVAFFEAMMQLGPTFKRIVSWAIATNLARESIKTADQGTPILTLDAAMPWRDVVIEELPHVKFVVAPSTSGRDWRVELVPINPCSRRYRKPLPTAWEGSGHEISSVSGVQDAVYCPQGGFVVIAKSRDAAFKLAELALASR